MRIRLLQYFLLTNTLAFSSPVVSQERWFKIELSIFSNENSADRLEDQWHADRTELSYPGGLRRLNKLSDLLLTDSLLANSLNPFSSDDSENEQLTPEEVQAQIRAESIAAIGPSPPTNRSGFKLFDFLREDFLQLLTSESDFQQTNRTLERSSNHRLLFHGLWLSLIHI